MVRKVMLACVLLVICNNATAESSKHKGAYLGAGFGISTFDDDGAFSGFNFDDEDNSIQIYAGYKFMQYLAVEARYNDFGTFSLNTVGFDVSALSAHAVGIKPFGESGWELFGQLGLGVVTFDISGFGDEDETAVAAGIGVRFSPSPKFSLAIQTDVYVWEDTSLGPVFDLAVGGTQLSIQYIF